jgi:hypothetical protein
MAGQPIDRDKLRAAIRRIGSEYVFHMLDDAITLLPQTKLRKLIAQYLDPAELVLTTPERKVFSPMSRRFSRPAWPASITRLSP